MEPGGINLEHLEVARLYFFGEVKFLDLLLIVMAIDIVTGVFKAIKKGNLWSRKSLFGYARKLLVFAVIILANVMDQILGLGGALTYSTVLFYIASEILSVTENMSELGVLIPPAISDKLQVMNNEQQTDLFTEEIREEFSGKTEEEKDHE